MPTDLSFTRVVIACDAVGEHRATIEAAARFAAWFGATLRGVFIEDEALLHLAAIPFAKYIGATGQPPEPIDERATLHQFEAHAARVRAALASCAAAEEIGWSFDVLRGPLSVVNDALSERDLLVIETKSRPFAGALQLNSRLLNAALKTDHPLLLLRNGARPVTKIIALVQDPASAASRLITTAAKLAATVGSPLQVLLLPGTVDPAAALTLVTSVSEKVSAGCRVEQVSGDIGLCARRARPDLCWY